VDWVRRGEGGGRWSSRATGVLRGSDEAIVDVFVTSGCDFRKGSISGKVESDRWVSFLLHFAFFARHCPSAFCSLPLDTAISTGLHLSLAGPLARDTMDAAADLHQVSIYRSRVVCSGAATKQGSNGFCRLCPISRIVRVIVPCASSDATTASSLAAVPCAVHIDSQTRNPH
jgi:hypothetical protein